ncbi:hypothetical protein MCUN1_000261 [Malassezia cuniculi]|uniref:CRAL-TRIO domain-containing protein n=1 Tax=Malassezia cuniculi TaxID=948313 RepID=A0AAF0J4R3_9BASI|nr:hypothetical protein MCUN1_000261 [Malassezia cuniculi]
MTPAIGAAAAYDNLQKQYAAHAEDVVALHESLLGELANVIQEPYTNIELATARNFVDDPECVFRFLRRNKFDVKAAREAIIHAIQWRRERGIDSAASGTLVSPYMSDTSDHVPLFWMHSRFRDCFGRPCLHVALRHLERSPDGSLDELRDIIIVCLEVGRRYLQRVNRRRKQGVPPVLQLSLMLDVRSIGAANLELELIPYVREHMRLYYPGLFGTVYVVHYSWFQSGIWRMAKPLFPASLLSRVRVSDEAELVDHFGPALPKHAGGKLDIPMLVDSSDVFHTLGRVQPRRTASERMDYESIYDVVSRCGTPYSNSRVMTPMASVPGTPSLRPYGSIAAGITPNAIAESLRVLAEQEGKSGYEQWVSWDFGLPLPRISVLPEWPAWSFWERKNNNIHEPRRVIGHSTPTGPSAQTPPGRADADNDVPPADIGLARHASPSRGGSGSGSAGGHEAPNAREVSPFHPQNPYFGYPATLIEGDNSENSRRRAQGRRVHAKRQKRHLLRTLLYLFMLRVLHVYRQLRRGIQTLVWSIIDMRLLGDRNRLTLTEALSSSSAARITMLIGLLALAWPRQKAPLHLVLAANSG